jgi:hypothetical protein
MRQPRGVTGFVALALLLLSLIAPPANAGTVTSSNADASGLCTQTIDQVSSVTVNRYGNDCVIRFARVGTTVWTVPASVSKIAVLIVAGGGGGGFDVAGGGGAGGLLYYGSESPKTPNGETLTVTSGSLTVVVGDGGAGATSTSTPFGSDSTGRGVNGADSSITLPAGTVLTAKGGGGGNSRNNTSTAQTGGSGGGGGYGNGSPTAAGSGTGTGVTRQGYAGGRIANGNKGGGGGGGAGAVGANWDDTVTDTGGGGNGLQYSISGSATYYGGGGGGGSWDTKGGIGGLGGGGNGGSMSAATCRSNCSSDYSARTGNPGTANTGGGGGGSGNATGNPPAGAGGSGVVIIRYTNILSATATISIAGGSLVYRTARNISVTTSTAGKVDFKANGKYIGGCRNVASTAGSSFTATCAYRPSFRGRINITADFKPSDAGYIGTSAALPGVLVLNRAGNR